MINLNKFKTEICLLIYTIIIRESERGRQSREDDNTCPEGVTGSLEVRVQVVQDGEEVWTLSHLSLHRSYTAALTVRERISDVLSGRYSRLLINLNDSVFIFNILNANPIFYL